MKAHLFRILATALASAVILTSGPALAAAEPHPPQAGLPGLAELVDRVVPEQLARDRIPGAAVVVVSGGRTVLAKGYGVADVATRRPIDPAAPTSSPARSPSCSPPRPRCGSSMTASSTCERTSTGT